MEYGFLNTKTKNVTEWTEVRENYGNDDYGAQIEAQAEVNEKPAPTHSDDKSYLYYDGKASGVQSNIKTRLGWEIR